MPWGWECRSRLVKQIPSKPTESRRTEDVQLPGPNHYDTPSIFCGTGYSKIRRAPAYTFGLRLPADMRKPAILPRAPGLNTQGIARNGVHKITHGVVTPRIESPRFKVKIPGPNAYAPHLQVRVKRPPAYSMRPAARPPYQSFDMWTPSPNMYWPVIPGKKPPAFSFGYGNRELKPQQIPAPGAHNPKFEYVMKSKPAFSLSGPFTTSKTKAVTPAPNTYCEKKFLYPKPFPPTPSFGIKHSPYLGKEREFLKSSKLDLLEVK